MLDNENLSVISGYTNYCLRNIKMFLRIIGNIFVHLLVIVYVYRGLSTLYITLSTGTKKVELSVSRCNLVLHFTLSFLHLHHCERSMLTSDTLPIYELHEFEKKLWFYISTYRATSRFSFKIRISPPNISVFCEMYPTI